MSFFNTAPVATPAPAQGFTPPAQPPAPLPVQYALPPAVYALPSAHNLTPDPRYGAPAPQARAFDPHAAEAIVGLIGGEPVNPGSNTVKLKQSPHGHYLLRIINMTKFNGYKIGPAVAVDFEIVQSSNGQQGVRSHLFQLSGPGEQARYRADEVTNFLIACGAARETANAAFREVLANPAVLNGKTIEAEVVAARNPQYNDAKFSRAAT